MGILSDDWVARAPTLYTKSIPCPWEDMLAVMLGFGGGGVLEPVDRGPGAGPVYAGFHRFTANWWAADTVNTLKQI